MSNSTLWRLTSLTCLALFGCEIQKVAKDWREVAKKADVVMEVTTNLEARAYRTLDDTSAGIAALTNALTVIQAEIQSLKQQVARQAQETQAEIYSVLRWSAMALVSFVVVVWLLRHRLYARLQKQHVAWKSRQRI